MKYWKAVQKVINYISVKTIKLTNLFTSLLIFAMIAVAILGYQIDKRFAGGYYSNYLIQKIFLDELDWFFKFSNFAEQKRALFITIVAASVLIFIFIKIVLRKRLVKGRNKHNLSTNIFYFVINIFASTAAFAVVVVLVVNGMVTQYVNATINSNDNFFYKVDTLKKQIESDRSLSTIVLNKMMFDIKLDAQYMTSKTMDERINICKEINHLIDLQGGPLTPEEHYLRNYLNYAPENLNEMQKEIQDGNMFGWQLLAPEQSVLHMLGQNGEYNIKFVSANGLFEAVYNKDGELLTQESDSLNMGTYNYADPIKEPNKHSTYDVTPYYLWGNTSPDEVSLSVEVYENLDKFYLNKDALKRYNNMKDLVSSANAVHKK